MVDNNTNEPGTPPSFVPAGTPKRRTGATPAADGSDTHKLTPPSFTPPPVRRSIGNNPREAQASPSQQGHGSRQTIRTTPQSDAARQPRRTQGSTASHGGASPQRFDAKSHPAATRPVQTPRNNLRSNSKPSTQAAVSATRHVNHKALKITAGVLVALLLALAIGLVGIWNWVDGKLTKTPWLTSAPQSSATSWLLLGSDQRDGSTGADSSSGTPGARTDTILVLTKPKQGNSSLISIPRDSLVKIGSAYMKINAVMQNYGNKAMVGQIERITGNKIDHVAEIRFGGLKNVVDALGGVQLCYNSTVNDPNSGLNWKAGCHLADGGTALAFSRMRYSDPLGDFGREARQRQVIAAITKKATSASVLTNVGTLGKVAQTALASVTVDDKSNPYTLLQMALAFRDASGTSGVTGSVFWTDPGYYVSGVGSSVLLDDTKNLQLFSQLESGTHAHGVVGGITQA